MQASLTILIDSSNPLTVQQLQYHLSAKGQKTICTDRLHGGLSALSAGTVDAAFIDLENPHVNTAQLLSHLNAHKPYHLIAVRSHERALPQTVKDQPFDDILTRPFLTQTIKKIMAQIIEKQHRHSNTPLPADFLAPLLTKTQQNKKLAQTLLERCFDDFPKQLSEIQTSVDQQNIEQLQNCAHKLNGSAAFCGLTSIQLAAQHLETLAKNNTVKQFDSALESLNKTVQSFRNQQEQLLNQLKD